VTVGLPAAKYGDYTPVVLGLVLVAAFSASPIITIVASVKLADQSRRWSILVALVPMLLSTLTILAAEVALVVLDPED
jgi:hypothetical protein